MQVKQQVATAAFPVALEPSMPRDGCRLLIARRSGSAAEHIYFREIIKFFKPGDCLVVNMSRVFPARIPFWIGEKKGDLLLGGLPKTNGAALAKLESRHARRLSKNNGRVRFQDGSEGRIQITGFDEANGAYQITIETKSPWEALGEVPLPPYIVRSRKAAGFPELTPEDVERYQCVYASVPGSAACPTAGLHWTDQLLDELRGRGVTVARVVLHVGFASIVHGVGRDRVPVEEMAITSEEAEMINKVKTGGGRVFACGTSVVRALESAADEAGSLKPAEGPTELFIRPGHRFRIVDAMITNFHLPESTNFLMTQAFLGDALNLEKLYQEAAGKGYRFYSYGDAMLIL
ncbi:MAG: S-adenosylmethionine:tRNA ribosyltransferase-isomerase [Elusimicrobia bacterium]|nr:S-adenosylmethionine:tRNA ribosyltransferase-isomerase [Elusimicrobiota bacterium]